LKIGNLLISIYFFIKGVLDMSVKDKITLRMQIRSNILEKTGIKNKRLAEEIARKWAKL